MRNHTIGVSGLLILSSFCVNMASAASPAYTRDVPATLMAEAKISESAAVKSALAHVKGGRIVALELEREGGKLLYSLDIHVPGKSGIEEVHVNAMDGAVLSVHHESAKDEKAEAAADKKAAAAHQAP